MDRTIWAARFLLVFHALTSVGYGISVLINPAAQAAFMGLAIVNGDGSAELITMYVGSAGAVGLFMLYGAINIEWLPQAFLFLVISMTGITLVRLLTIFFFETGSYITNALIYDVPVIIATWLVYFRLGHSHR